jgi:hypothetical protein
MCNLCMRQSRDLIHGPVDEVAEGLLVLNSSIAGLALLRAASLVMLEYMALLKAGGGNICRGGKGSDLISNEASM